MVVLQREPDPAREGESLTELSRDLHPASAVQVAGSGGPVTAATDTA